MEKQSFDFYQDVKVTVWFRQKFTIEAESKEEALKEVEKFKTEDIGTSEDSHLIWDTDWMSDTWENIPLEENGGRATIELYDADSEKMIGNNAMIGKEPRIFKKGERVCYEDEHGTPHKAMVTHDQRSEYEEDEIELFIFLDEEDDDSQGIDTRNVKARGIYQLSEDGKTCPKCGEPLYDEHLEHMDCPYYCPWCQENFYDIEV